MSPSVIQRAFAQGRGAGGHRSSTKAPAPAWRARAALERASACAMVGLPGSESPLPVAFPQRCAAVGAPPRPGASVPPRNVVASDAPNGSTRTGEEVTPVAEKKPAKQTGKKPGSGK
ncbi:hypothetical protein LIP_0774 [Limnochorda pilosa]|uniref:Uncharacterized protein n=1 Tax=Limnochorda pilosa TaxID=1555112 RepID=A0A0K2SHN8_LIMPI|nr:hypothetical protein LIP_0774 [Limnochorda pilosa]